MHTWGDKDFDWDGLNDAGSYIARRCRRRAWFHLHWKEKYGSLRLEWINSALFYLPIHSIFYPGHLYVRYSHWVLVLDRKLGKVCYKMGITNAIRNYQMKVLSLKF